MKTYIASVVLFSALLVGCAANKVAEDKYSGFLDDYTLLSEGTSQDEDTMGYVTPGINWQKYDSIMIDKVRVIRPEGEVKNPSRILTAVVDKYEELLRQELNKDFNVVNEAGPGTIRLQTAITSVYTSHDDLKGYQFIPISAVVVAAGRATGLEKQSSRVMSELRIVDSVDGQLLGQAVDLKAGEKKQDKDSAILLADVVPILEQWASRVGDRLRGLKAHAKK